MFAINIYVGGVGWYAATIALAAKRPMMVNVGSMPATPLLYRRPETA